MTRDEAIEILGLVSEVHGVWRYSAPTGQLVFLARRSKPCFIPRSELRLVPVAALPAPPRVPTFPSAEECNAVVELFNKLDTRQAAARRSLEGKALREHADRVARITGVSQNQSTAKTAVGGGSDP